MINNICPEGGSLNHFLKMMYVGMSVFVVTQVYILYRCPRGYQKTSVHSFVRGHWNKPDSEMRAGDKPEQLLHLHIYPKTHTLESVRFKLAWGSNAIVVGKRLLWHFYFASLRVYIRSQPDTLRSVLAKISISCLMSWRLLFDINRSSRPISTLQYA